MIGDRGLKTGEVEYADRTNLVEKTMVKVEEAAEFVASRVAR